MEDIALIKASDLSGLIESIHSLTGKVQTLSEQISKQNDGLITRNEAMKVAMLKATQFQEYVKGGWIINYGKENSPLYLKSECQTARVRKKQSDSKFHKFVM